MVSKKNAYLIYMLIRYFASANYMNKEHFH